MSPGTKLRPKPDTWFDAGTEAELLVDCMPAGWLVLGIKDGKPDEELCSPDEFEVLE